MKRMITICISSFILVFVICSLYSNKMIISDYISTLKNKKGNTAYLDNAFIPYKVKKGDTIYGICIENVASFSVSKASKMIMEKNNIKGNEDIKEGQIILIPYKNPVNEIEYVVKKGDSLLSIAHNLMPGKSLNDGINEIIENNDLESSEGIEEGQILLIPCDK